MITVIAAIIHHQDRILIARRAPHKFLAGFWEFPGGKLEKGETPEACLIREIQEELKIKIKVGQYLTTNIHDYGKIQIELLAYNCIYLEGEIELIDHDEFRWVDLKELNNCYWAPADLPIVKHLQGD